MNASFDPALTFSETIQKIMESSPEIPYKNAFGTSGLSQTNLLAIDFLQIWLPFVAKNKDYSSEAHRFIAFRIYCLDLNKGTPNGYVEKLQKPSDSNERDFFSKLESLFYNDGESEESDAKQDNSARYKWFLQNVLTCDILGYLAERDCSKKSALSMQLYYRSLLREDWNNGEIASHILPMPVREKFEALLNDPLEQDSRLRLFFFYYVQSYCEESNDVAGTASAESDQEDDDMQTELQDLIFFVFENEEKDGKRDRMTRTLQTILCYGLAKAAIDWSRFYELYKMIDSLDKLEPKNLMAVGILGIFRYDVKLLEQDAAIAKKLLASCNDLEAVYTFFCNDLSCEDCSRHYLEFYDSQFESVEYAPYDAARTSFKEMLSHSDNEAGQSIDARKVKRHIMACLSLYEHYVDKHAGNNP